MESLLGAAAGAFLSRFLLEELREISLPFGLMLADGSTVWEPGAWRYALFGLVMVLTLRFARNGILYPVFQWFAERDVALQETVSKRVLSQNSESTDDDLADADGVS